MSYENTPHPTPSGFVDIFSKSKHRLGDHASKILKFLHRNRIPSNAIPFPLLEGYNSICTMRAKVMQDYLDYLLQKEKGKHCVASLCCKRAFKAVFSTLSEHSLFSTQFSNKQRQSTLLTPDLWLTSS